MLGIVRPWARICSIYHVSICISCVQVTASNNAIIPAQRNGIKNISCLEMFIEWRSAGQRGARGAASESNANISWGCRAQQSSPDLTPATISCHLVPSLLTPHSCQHTIFSSWSITNVRKRQDLWPGEGKRSAFTPVKAHKNDHPPFSYLFNLDIQLLAKYGVILDIRKQLDRQLLNRHGLLQVRHGHQLSIPSRQVGSWLWVWWGEGGGLLIPCSCSSSVLRRGAPPCIIKIPR